MGQKTEIRVNFSTKFKKMCFKQGLDEEDLNSLEHEVVDFELNREKKDEHLGDKIAQSGGAFKLRFSGRKSNSGKSGSSRMIYFTYDSSKNYREYNFILCYSKNQKSSLTDAEKQGLKKIITQHKKSRK